MDSPSSSIAIDATDIGSKRDLWGAYYIDDKCRGCGNIYIRYEKNKYSASYYRCKKCTSDKACIRNILYSCSIQ